MTPTIHFQNSCCKPKYFDPSDLFLLFVQLWNSGPKESVYWFIDASSAVRKRPYCSLVQSLELFRCLFFLSSRVVSRYLFYLSLPRAALNNSHASYAQEDCSVKYVDTRNFFSTCKCLTSRPKKKKWHRYSFLLVHPMKMSITSS